jgi:dTDP-4-dehydrorhamnose reductase
MTTLLLFGAGGQLGREVVDRARQTGVLVAARTRAEIDIADSAMVQRALEQVGPAIVVNAAAYTKVDLAEAEAEQALRANAVAPGVLAAACAALDIPLVHLSTDYVFDGSKPSAYQESDPVKPLNVYGASKAAGEEAIRQACGRHLILRTSWVFGRHGMNFVKTVLRLSAERDRISIVTDQHGCPTAAADLAEAILALAPAVVGGDVPSGTYHFAGEEATTWHDFAQEIVARQAPLTGRRPTIVPITTAEFAAQAPRPQNSRLDSSKFRATFPVRTRPWQQHVRDLVPRLIAEGSI